MHPAEASEQILHASSVAVGEVGVLLIGASGCGKSSLSLQLMGLGAELVADDRVLLKREGRNVLLSRPEALPPLIEARGLGLLRAASIPTARLCWVVDLDAVETDRLPRARKIALLGREFPLLR
ncbi:HPr kinase/phosphorylase, partial [Cribrihabitans sp. XS_ASV171]